MMEIEVVHGIDKWVSTHQGELAAVVAECQICQKQGLTLTFLYDTIPTDDLSATR